MIKEETEYSYKSTQKRFAQIKAIEEENGSCSSSTQPNSCQIEIRRIPKSFTAPNRGQVLSSIHLPTLFRFYS